MKVGPNTVVAEAIGSGRIEVRIVQAATQTAQFGLALPEARLLVRRLEFALARAVAGKYADREPVERSALR